MRGEEGEEAAAEEEVQVITLVTLTFWVWGFRVQPIIEKNAIAALFNIFEAAVSFNKIMNKNKI